MYRSHTGSEQRTVSVFPKSITPFRVIRYSRENLGEVGERLRYLVRICVILLLQCCQMDRKNVNV